MNSTPKLTLHTGKFIALVKEGHWEYADRTNATGASIIVALTEEQKLLVDAWLEDKARSGVLVDPKIYAGLYFIGRRLPST